jgi:hypothetical protein
VREIEQAVDILKRKGLVADADDRYVLTLAGVDQAEALWRIASEQQDKVFGAFSEEQIDTFKAMLKAVIAIG